MNRHHLNILGRLLLSSIFIISALGKIMDWSGNLEMMAAKGLPLVPFFLAAALIIELLGGLALLLGWHTRWSAGLLFFYLIPVTLIMHNFWAAQGAEQQMQLIHFLKNIGIMGGLLVAAAADEAAVATTDEYAEDDFEEMPMRSRVVRRGQRRPNATSLNWRWAVGFGHSISEFNRRKLPAPNAMIPLRSRRW